MSNDLSGGEAASPTTKLSFQRVRKHATKVILLVGLSLAIVPIVSKNHWTRAVEFVDLATTNLNREPDISWYISGDHGNVFAVFIASKGALKSTKIEIPKQFSVASNLCERARKFGPALSFRRDDECAANVVGDKLELTMKNEKVASGEMPAFVYWEGRSKSFVSDDWVIAAVGGLSNWRLSSLDTNNGEVCAAPGISGANGSSQCLNMDVEMGRSYDTVKDKFDKPDYFGRIEMQTEYKKIKESSELLVVFLEFLAALLVAFFVIDIFEEDVTTSMIIYRAVNALFGKIIPLGGA